MNEHFRLRRRCAIAVSVTAMLSDRLRQEQAQRTAARPEAEAPTPVTVETAVKGAIDRVVTADAVLYPVNQAPVTSKINAPVTQVLVNRGDHVRAGQVLVVLESADLAAAANESQYQYQQTQAAYDLLTGATVVDDRTKARGGCAIRQGSAGGRQEAVRQSCGGAARRRAGAEAGG